MWIGNSRQNAIIKLLQEYWKISKKKFQARGDYVVEEKVIFECVFLLKVWLESPKSLYNKERFLQEGASLEKSIRSLLRGLSGNVVNAGDLLVAIKNVEYVSVCYNMQNFIFGNKTLAKIKQYILDALSYW